MATSIFRSQSPGVVRVLSGLLSAKAVVACAGGSYFVSRVFSPSPSAPPSLPDLTDLPAVASVLASSPDARLAATCFTLGALSQWFSHRVLSRVVVSIDRLPAPADDADPDNDVLHVHRMAALGGTVKTVCRRSDVLPAQPGSKMANFVLKSESGWERVMYLLPSDDWSSEDKPYLRRLVYEAYFRDEPAPPPDAELLAVEGFGPFRPAVFADPASPQAKALAEGVAPAANNTDDALVPDTCFQRDGEVYAEFIIPKKPSLAEKRRRSTAKALKKTTNNTKTIDGGDGGDGDAPPRASLPPLPSPTVTPPELDAGETDQTKTLSK